MLDTTESVFNIATPPAARTPDHATRLRGKLSASVLALAFVLVPSPRCAAQTPLSLHDAVDQALKSPSAQVAEAQVEEARGAVRQAGLGLNPRLYLQSEDIRPWADNFSFPTQTEDYGYLGQTLETAGKRGKRVALARSRLGEAEASRALRRRQIAGRVSTAYWNAVSLARIADVLREDQQAVAEMVRYHQERVDAGATRGVDLLRMEIEQDRLEIASGSAAREADQARLELFVQMGQPVAEVRLTGALETVPDIAPVDPAAVLEGRPDILLAREAITAAEADLRLQKANAAPDPDLLAGYKRNGADNTLYASVQIPLPFHNRNQGEIGRAQASVAGAQASLALLNTEVRLEVQQARQSYEAQRKIVTETLPEMRSRARRHLEIVTEAYRLGGVDLLRFLDAERTEFDVEVSAIRTLAQLQQGAIQLQLAYGVQP